MYIYVQTCHLQVYMCIYMYIFVMFVVDVYMSQILLNMSYIYMCIYIYIFVYMSSIYIYIYTYIYTCHIYIHIYKHVLCIRIHFIHTYIYIYMFIYTFIYIERDVIYISVNMSYIFVLYICKYIHGSRFQFGSRSWLKSVLRRP